MAEVMLLSGVTRSAFGAFSVNDPLTQGLLIGFLGSGLYFAIDRYEPIERWPSCSNFLLYYGQPQPCFTASVCLATDFSNSKIRLHEKAPAV